MRPTAAAPRAARQVQLGPRPRPTNNSRHKSSLSPRASRASRSYASASPRARAASRSRQRDISSTLPSPASNPRPSRSRAYASSRARIHPCPHRRPTRTHAEFRPHQLQQTTPNRTTPDRSAAQIKREATPRAMVRSRHDRPRPLRLQTLPRHQGTLHPRTPLRARTRRPRLQTRIRELPSRPLRASPRLQSLPFRLRLRRTETA